MEIKINYIPINWNDYINLERRNKYAANNLKQKEKRIIELSDIPEYKGNYPIKLILKPHFKDYRQDLDNFRYKGILDGLISSKVLKNDNLRHIQEIQIKPIFDEEECVEIEIKEI